MPESTTLPKSSSESNDQNLMFDVAKQEASIANTEDYVRKSSTQYSMLFYYKRALSTLTFWLNYPDFWISPLFSSTPGF